MPKAPRQTPAAGTGPDSAAVGVGGEQAADVLLARNANFQPLTATTSSGYKIEFRRIPVPQHRLTPLKKSWMEVYSTVTGNLKLDMRMNLKTRKVEIKTTKEQRDTGLLQKAADLVNAFILGFELKDALALVRMDNLYIETFEIKDVKTLKGEHLSRAIGRLAGKDGRTKFTIENASRTRIVLSDTKIHIMGSFQNIRVARDSICALIMGSPAAKVYTRLRNTAARLNSS